MDFFVRCLVSTMHDPHEEARRMLHPDVYVKLTNLRIDELHREAERRRLVRAAREGRSSAAHRDRRSVTPSHLAGAGLPRWVTR